MSGRTTRRQVLVFGAGGVGAWALGLSGCAILRGGAVHRSLEPSRAEQEGSTLRIPLGELGDLRPGDALSVDPGGTWPVFLLARSAQGFPFAAVTAVCTHKGCTVDRAKDGEGWACPCHDSRFAEDGQVLKGPAQEPLGKPRLALERPAGASEANILVVELSGLEGARQA